MSTYDEIRAEVERSIGKHGMQEHVALGTGSHTLPLSGLGTRAGVSSVAGHLAAVAKRATDTRAAAGTVTWRDILLEEVFEALAGDEPRDVRAELVQVAAVVVKTIAAVDGVDPRWTALAVDADGPVARCDVCGAELAGDGTIEHAADGAHVREPSYAAVLGYPDLEPGEMAAIEADDLGKAAREGDRG